MAKKYCFVAERRFGGVFTLAFAIVAILPLLSGDPPRVWAIVVALVVSAVAALRPTWLRPANRLWLRFGDLLHRVTNPIFLGLVFFCAITPYAIVLRLIGRDALALKIDRDTSTYWIKREPPGPKPETLTRQY